MRVNQQPGFVLHTRPYSETSLLIDVFCRQQGRFMLLSKGARRLKSGLRGILMPFTPLLMSWSGKGQLPILTNAETLGYSPVLCGDARHSAYYINELILKLLHRFDEHADLYDAYHTALHGLTRGDDAAVVLRIFEKKLLKETGFGLILDHDVDTGEVVQKEVDYYYVPERGPVATSMEQELNSANGYRISGKTLQAIDSEQFDAASLRQARSLMRSLIQLQLGGKSMRSRRVMMEVINYKGAGKA